MEQLKPRDISLLIKRGDCDGEGTPIDVHDDEINVEAEMFITPESIRDLGIDHLEKMVYLFCPTAEVTEKGKLYFITTDDGDEMEASEFLSHSITSGISNALKIQEVGFEAYVRSLHLMNDGVAQLAHRLSAECSTAVPGFSDEEVFRIQSTASPNYFNYGETLDQAMRAVCPKGEYDKRDANTILTAADLRRKYMKKF